jgi:hypothetical protein
MEHESCVKAAPILPWNYRSTLVVVATCRRYYRFHHRDSNGIFLIQTAR